MSSKNVKITIITSPKQIKDANIEIIKQKYKHKKRNKLSKKQIKVADIEIYKVSTNLINS